MFLPASCRPSRRRSLDLSVPRINHLKYLTPSHTSEFMAPVSVRTSMYLLKSPTHYVREPLQLFECVAKQLLGACVQRGQRRGLRRGQHIGVGQRQSDHCSDGECVRAADVYGEASALPRADGEDYALPHAAPNFSQEVGVEPWVAGEAAAEASPLANP